MKRLIIQLATGLGVGRCPLVPGTVGTLLGVILYLILARVFSSLISYAIAVGVLFLVGVWISGEAEKYLHNKDDQLIVFDEIVGFPVAMFALPSSFLYILAGFVLFRIFDVVKPFRIERIQKLRGGWGIMGDDLAAAILANVVIQVFRIMLGW